MLEKRGPLAFYHFREALTQEEAHEHLVRLLDNTDITKMPQKKGKGRHILEKMLNICDPTSPERGRCPQYIQFQLYK